MRFSITQNLHDVAFEDDEERDFLISKDDEIEEISHSLAREIQKRRMPSPFRHSIQKLIMNVSDQIECDDEGYRSRSSSHGSACTDQTLTSSHDEGDIFGDDLYRYLEDDDYRSQDGKKFEVEKKDQRQLDDDSDNDSDDEFGCRDFHNVDAIHSDGLIPLDIVLVRRVRFLLLRLRPRHLGEVLRRFKKRLTQRNRPYAFPVSDQKTTFLSLPESVRMNVYRLVLIAIRPRKMFYDANHASGRTRYICTNSSDFGKPGRIAVQHRKMPWHMLKVCKSMRIDFLSVFWQHHHPHVWNGWIKWIIPRYYPVHEAHEGSGTALTAYTRDLTRSRPKYLAFEGQECSILLSLIECPQQNQLPPQPIGYAHQLRDFRCEKKLAVQVTTTTLPHGGPKLAALTADLLWKLEVTLDQEDGNPPLDDHVYRIRLLVMSRACSSIDQELAGDVPHGSGVVFRRSHPYMRDLVAGNAL